MDLRKTLQTVAGRTSKSIGGLSIGNIALQSGALITLLILALLGQRYNYVNVNLTTTDNNPARADHMESTATHPTATTADMAGELSTTGFINRGGIDKSTDKSTDKRSIKDTNKQTLVTSIPNGLLATSMTGARVPLADFTSLPSTAMEPLETTKHYQAHANEYAQAQAQAKYQFNRALNNTLFKAVVSSPFAVGFGEDAKLAVWHENARFALIDKAKQFVILLDPGHGGTDPGSIGHNGLEEKTLTLDIAKRAEQLLSKNKNISVVLTRTGDNGMSRMHRVHKVKTSKADMFVSLHLNHLPQTDVNLVETFYAAPHNILESMEKQHAERTGNRIVKTAAMGNHNLAFTQGSRQLASIMQKRVFNEVMHNNPSTDNAGIKEDTLYILTRSFTPGALIEMSCLSNVQEAERLNEPAYRQKLATALANGILDYLASPAAKRQFGSEV